MTRNPPEGKSYVRSGAVKFGFNKLDSDTPGSYKFATGEMDFNKEVSHYLRILFGRKPLPIAEYGVAKNAIRVVLHETRHASNSASFNELVVSDNLYHREKWAENFEEGVTEAWARQNVDLYAKKFGFIETYKGFGDVQLNPDKLHYKIETSAIKSLATWIEKKGGPPAKNIIEKLALRKTNVSGPGYLADEIIRVDARIKPLRISSKQALQHSLVTHIQESFKNKGRFVEENIESVIQKELARGVKRHDH